jgi:serine phosphatase RsbU (regulator of sigma subunit)/pSer/pThr/pTyr-binding forkhead associated (FHA) protein
MLKLIGTDGKRFYSWPLEPGQYKVGREPECDIYIPNKTVSRNHARIEVNPDGDQHFLTDLNSHNGTFVNGNGINSRVQIKLDDLIMFGRTEFRLTPANEISDPSVNKTRTKLSDHDPENSVFLSIDEALKPLPLKAADIPELLPTLFEMAKMLVLPEPKEIMLKRSLQMISKIIPADRLAILTVSDDQQEVYTAAILLPDGKDPGTFTLSRTIVNEIMTNKNSILISNPENDPRFAEQKSIIMSRIKSAIAVPLFDEGRVLGILYTDTANPVHHYNDEHMRVLATFGNIIASRLLNYELLTERQEKQIIEAELRRASLIQKNLLVSSPPEIPEYEIYAFQEQSYSVGGDLYDIELLPDGRLLFMVADVSGKGMGAALRMSNILASFRILYESKDFELCRAVERVSLQMHRYSAPGDFATLFIGLAEPNENRIRFVNAGHNPPLLVRANGTIEYLETSGLMIGAFDFASWTEGMVELAKNDLLFVFSDGVTEAERDDVQYGDERMEQLIVNMREKHPRKIVGHLMDDINDFMGDAPRSDDITIFQIKRVK